MTTIPNEAYYKWLVAQINVPNNGKTYEGIFKRMYNYIFVAFVALDDNRIGDAQELRKEFFGESHVNIYEASVLEVLVALSRRAAWIISDIPAQDWVWTFIKNLGLHKCDDPLSYRKDNKVDDILETFVWRIYEPNGEGGLFPLKQTEHDQRTIELWYQMHAYIMEKIPI